MIEKLEPAERQAALAKLDGWTSVEGRDAITKVFTFGDFQEAFAFMTRSALLAERMNHHPEWSNVYRTVTVTLATHVVDGVTSFDIKLAEGMNRFAGQGG
ncbi:4a-hydroxytetrahydrobiopterin dehydratase [Kaistia sp. MMO-174]|uniref:4a-hydroxytetrahydrobiopterin dehydratase n=1 Tax=Kaistia sp. MMO-174 TaxID=3081256 RepID=UPI001ACA1C6B|nr:4a-hydroxytetrahydrobiopterin dehydratase [Hyphomicrobiales bacterium]MBN9058394.1 4a-hydroxytetrahydrobiopterin dehydratase [Hyphomicrobiales bacterium]